MATLGAENEAEEQVRFLGWMDTAEFPLSLAVKREHGAWFALLIQFDITGSGSTQQEAINEAFSMLFAYLRAYYEDGAPLAAAVRPVPLSLRMRIEVETLAARVLRKLPLRMPLSDESRYELPPGQLSKLAPC